MLFFKKLAIAGLAFCFSAGATAGLILDRTSFDAAIRDAIVDDYTNPGYSFSQSDAVMSAVLGETGYTSTTWSNNNIVVRTDTYYCAGCNGSFLLDFTSTSIGSASGVFGVGFEYFNGRASQDLFAFVTFGDGSSSNFQLDYVPSTGNPLSHFFGVTSAAGIASLHVGLANGVPVEVASRAIGIDNLTIGCDPSQNSCTGLPTSVPVPATLALFGLALAGLGWTRRQRC